jgi:hypothetical protein
MRLPLDRLYRRWILVSVTALVWCVALSASNGQGAEGKAHDCVPGKRAFRQPVPSPDGRYRVTNVFCSDQTRRALALARIIREGRYERQFVAQSGNESR